MTSPRRGTPDFLLLFLTFLLVCFGLAMVFSASMGYVRVVQIDPDTKVSVNDPSYLVVRQAIFVAMGTVAMFFCMNIDFRKLKNWVRPSFIAVVVMLLLVPIIGREVNGAKSWFYIGGFGIQPAEFAKLSVILYLASLISKKEDKFQEFRSGLLPALVIVGFISALIMLQPDLGSTMILVMCSAIVIIAGGANFKHLFYLGTAGAAAISVVAVASLMKPGKNYRLDRFTSFMNPWNDPLDTGYHLIQSLYAFGHGGFTGAGFGQSIQKLHYLPEAHNDFIFAIIGEELGFLGSSLFLLIYLAFLWRGLFIALRCSDTFGTLAGIGIIGMIGVQALINLGGVTGSIPLTGVTLPLISYGGSSMLVTLVSIGILLSLSREHNKPDKENATKKRA
ncbi:putative lipid II flippase FtsW [Paenibacillus doosanensis]|uniref:Probable peptidoglycan glycosyltransferase FtsW n=1 Tax=Paenibacillus konkukensis TaxID=2020716 RepID=A0ABY4S1H2_9BACL|nr:MULTISPECIES: putative lipid II flippase FtsW [Paenibacillus]MCS7459430.1 putative lipid II flippase FtsW [Paenibacillus doosanensis]UQZ87224.1 Lipid II flippase FtsW [Paenibacillus konkukensis]